MSHVVAELIRPDDLAHSVAGAGMNYLDAIRGGKEIGGWHACLLSDDHAEDLDHVHVLLALVAARLGLNARHLKGMVPARQRPCPCKADLMSTHSSNQGVACAQFGRSPS